MRLRALAGVFARVRFADFIDLPGATGDYASTPDAAANDVTGDLDVRVLVRNDDWSRAASQTLMAKYNINAQRSWQFFLNINGTPSITISADGVNAIGMNADTNPLLTDGALYWLRFTLDVNNGSGGKDAFFYYSTAIDTPVWNQIGGVVTNAGTITLHNSSGKLTVGSFDVDGGGTGNPLTGKIHKAELRSGINGSIVAHFDASRALVGASSFVAATGETWTKQGNAAFVA
jgi:hypothetical protein